MIGRLLFVLVALSASPVLAQDTPMVASDPPATAARNLGAAIHRHALASPSGFNSDQRTLLPSLATTPRAPLTGSAQSSTAAPEKRSGQRKALGAIVGGVGGFFAGLFIGAAIEGDRCNCDDPGLTGALIGAPAGAIAGSILGYKFLF